MSPNDDRAPMYAPTETEAVVAAVAWLLSHPRTLERDHILAVLTWSIGALYGNDRVHTLPTDRSPK